MTRVALKGINVVRTRRRDGQVVEYYYHRATGTRLAGKPGSQEFLVTYNDAEKSIATRHTHGLFAGLMRDYSLSREFKSKLAVSTQREYSRKIAQLEIEFGDMPIAALNNPKVRRIFMDYREEVAGNSGDRESDYRLSVLSACLTWGVEHGRIEANHIKGFKRLYHSKRADMIWLPEHIEAFLKAAPVRMQQALVLALHTGLRQGDILRLTWNNYDGRSIRLRVGKNNRGGRLAPAVVIPCTKALRAMLDGMDRTSVLILTSPTGKPFTARNFGRQWEAAFAAAGLQGSDLHFNDLRGTAVTLLAQAGCTVPQIAAITKHSLQSATRILEVYLDPNRHLAEQAITLLENVPATDSAK